MIGRPFADMKLWKACCLLAGVGAFLSGLALQLGLLFLQAYRPVGKLQSLRDPGLLKWRSSEAVSGQAERKGHMQKSEVESEKPTVQLENLAVRIQGSNNFEERAESLQQSKPDPNHHY
jgi:hypothetical protein